jgi:hypothetical protein
MKKQWVFIFLLFLAAAAGAQTDTARLRDTTVLADSLVKAIDTVPAKPTYSFLLDSSIYNRQPYFSFTNATQRMVTVKSWEDKDAFFYITIALLIYFALVRNGFGRYTKDLFGLFFRTSLKQRQVKEQLMQVPLPSLLLNILFFLSGGLFIKLVLQYLGLGTGYNFWLLLLYCIAGLALVYIVKFITLKICGWLFRLSDAIDIYTFIVFTANKVIGIVLLPFLILLSFSTGVVQQAAFIISLLMVGALFIYRYFLSYLSVNRQVKINFFHFFLYLLAFEIIPLLLINKVLLQYLGENS